MTKWILIASVLIFLGAVVAILIGHSRESTKTDRLIESLLQSTSGSVLGPVESSYFAKLPPPLARYFRQVLTNGQQLIKTAKIRPRRYLTAIPLRFTAAGELRRCENL